MTEFLLLSLFPGIDALGYAFEQEWPDAAVVRGPDPIFGGDIRGFHVPKHRFDGIFGGPPCQPFSRLRHMVEANGYQPRHDNLIPEFERVVHEGVPRWFLMEEVPGAPLPAIVGYQTVSILLDNREVPAEPDGSVGPEQSRIRRFTFGTMRPHHGTASATLSFADRWDVERATLLSPIWEPAVAGDSRATPVRHTHGRGGAIVDKTTAKKPKRTIADMVRLQGLPEGFLDECPLTESGKRKAIGNAVPIPMGRAVARAVRRALGLPILSREQAD